MIKYMDILQADFAERKEKYNEDWMPFKLHNRFMSKLKHHYTCVEACEYWYDSSPDFDETEEYEELYNMYLDYEEGISQDVWARKALDIILRQDEIAENKRFSKGDYTIEELKAAHDKIEQMLKDYERERLSFNNWIEPYFEGNWGMSQKFVNNFARKILMKFKRSGDLKDRCYIRYNGEDRFTIFIYTRDKNYRDYYLYFVRNEVHKEDIKKREEKIKNQDNRTCNWWGYEHDDNEANTFDCDVLGCENCKYYEE